jgi:hypothetical protein
MVTQTLLNRNIPQRHITLKESTGTRAMIRGQHASIV